MFEYGVGSGDPSLSSAVIWTKLPEGCLRQVAWRVFDDREVISHGTAYADQTLAGSVHVLVSNLRPNTEYEYEFAVDDESSPRGRFCTLPEDAESVRFAVVACAKYNAGYFNAYRHVAQRDDIAFVLHLGDYIYETSNTPPPSQTPGAAIGRDFIPPHECVTLDDYRQRYAQYRSDPDLLELHRRHAVIATIDDHEIADNAWATGSDTHDETRDGPWSDRLRAALRAWEEWMPTLRRPTTGGDTIYRDVRLPELATIALLETRTHRTDPAAPPELHTALGNQQWQWLTDIASTCREPWFVLAVPSALAAFWSPDLDSEAEFSLRRLKLVEPSSGAPFHDLWDSYPGERQRVYSLLRSSPAAPLVLSGDVHIGIEAELRDGDVAFGLEWTTSSVTSQNLDDKMGWAPRTFSPELEEHVRAALPHIRWCDFDSHGYMLIELSRDGAKCDWCACETVLQPSDKVHVSYSSFVRRDRYAIRTEIT